MGGVGMRVLWVALAAIAFGSGVPVACGQASIAPGELVREVVYNEQHDHQHHGYWQYWVEKRTEAGLSVEEQVETAEGPVARLVRRGGHPLSPEEEQEEQVRLLRLASSAEEQARQLKKHDEDEGRIGHILALLPTAFEYLYDGEENGYHRLLFHPNRADVASSIEARVFHSMSGTLWVDAKAKRLVRLEGHVDENVDFGFGILGRLYKGGWFRLVRVQVSPTDWKTSSLEVHMNLRALLVKTFARETSEARGGFKPVPSGISLIQGLKLLNQSTQRSEAAECNVPKTGSGKVLLAPAALAMHP